jgi:glycerol-3-phosphate acyltransferase PlsY
VRLKGVDIRQHGSRNIGATNTLRVLGKPLGVTALFLDIAKGAVSVVLIARLPLLLGWPIWTYGPLLCGIAAILGHTFSLFIRFKGGKGVATSAGVFFALFPWPALVALGVFLATALTTRMVSAGSCLAAAALAVAIFFFEGDPVFRTVVVVVAALVVYRHRSNIGRMFKGEESRLW